MLHCFKTRTQCESMWEIVFVRFAFLLNCVLVSFANCNEPPKYLSQRMVGNNDAFTMWCNVTSFRDVELPPNDTFKYLGIYMKTGDSSMKQYAIYEPGAKARPTFFITPPGRVWKYSYDGGDMKPNRLFISLNLTVMDASCSDAGIYRCGVYIIGYHQVFYSTPAHLVQRSPMFSGDKRGCPGKSVVVPMVDKYIIAPNDTFTITCNVTKFYDVTLPPPGDFASIAILRQLPNGIRQRVATHSPWGRNYKDSGTNIPAGRQWTVVAEGQMEKMSVALTVNDAKCDDAGTFLCMITLLGQVERYIYSSPFNLAAKADPKITLNKITVRPSSGLNNQTSTNKVGETIYLECTYSGPENLTNRWVSTRHAYYLPGSVHYPVKVGRDKDYCPTYSYSSSYTFKTLKEDNDIRYFCFLYQNNVKINQTEIHFYIEDVRKERMRESMSLSLQVDATLTLVLCLLANYVGF